MEVYRILVGNISTRNAAIGPYTIVTNKTIIAIKKIIFNFNELPSTNPFFVSLSPLVLALLVIVNRLPSSKFLIVTLSEAFVTTLLLSRLIDSSVTIFFEVS